QPGHESRSPVNRAFITRAEFRTADSGRVEHRYPRNRRVEREEGHQTCPDSEGPGTFQISLKAAQVVETPPAHYGIERASTHRPSEPPPRPQFEARTSDPADCQEAPTRAQAREIVVRAAVW